MTVNNSTPSGSLPGIIAPLSGQSLGLQRAQVTNGIREVWNNRSFMFTCMHLMYILKLIWYK